MCSKKGKSCGRKRLELRLHIMQYAVFCCAMGIKPMMNCYVNYFIKYPLHVKINLHMIVSLLT